MRAPAERLYAFVGSNRWEKEQVLQRLKEAIHPLETRVFDIADKSLLWEELFQSLRTFPPESRSRLFLLKQIERCPVRFQEQLLSTLQKLPRQHIVVLETEGACLHTFLEPLEGEIEVRFFQPLRRDQLPAWLIARAQANGKQIAREACSEVLERGGEDLFFLDRAIEQLALYAKDRSLLTVDDVRRLIPPLLFRSGFELARAVGQRQVLEALKLLSQLSPRETPPALIGSMAWNLRRLRQAKDLLKKGYTREEISRRIGLRWEERELFLKAATSLREEEADQILQRLLRLDVETKSGISEGMEGLETFILSLAQERGEFSGEA